MEICFRLGPFGSFREAAASHATLWPLQRHQSCHRNVPGACNGPWYLFNVTNPAPDRSWYLFHVTIVAPERSWYLCNVTNPATEGSWWQFNVTNRTQERPGKPKGLPRNDQAIYQSCYLIMLLDHVTSQEKRSLPHSDRFHILICQFN